MATKKTEKVETEPKFTREQLVNSQRFQDNRDVAAAVLKDGKKYTIGEAETAIKNYLKGKVI